MRSPLRAPDRKTGEMVVLEREDFYGGEMDEGVYYAKAGAKKDGTITAVEARVLLANSLFPLFGVVQHLIENTCIPNIWGKMMAVKVNKGIHRGYPVRAERKLPHPESRL